MSKPVIDESVIGNYRGNNTGMRVLSLMDHCEEIGDERGFIMVKNLAAARLDNSEDDADTDTYMSMIGLLEIDWHDKVEDYFTDWERYTCGFVPRKYSYLFEIEKSKDDLSIM